MARAALDSAERPAIVEKKLASVTQAPIPAKKARRTFDVPDYRPLGPQPPQLNMPDCLAHRLVPWTRPHRCKFGFWIAHLAKVCSHLQLVQTNWFQGEVHCRLESQTRGTPHLHCLCYVPRGALELPLVHGSYRAARKRPRDAESPEVCPNRISIAA